MSRKIYSQAQLNDAVHAAKVSARQTQIIRSAAKMQEYVNEIRDLKNENAKWNDIREHLSDKVEHLTAENEALRKIISDLGEVSGTHKPCLESFDRQQEKIAWLEGAVETHKIKVTDISLEREMLKSDLESKLAAAIAALGSNVQEAMSAVAMNVAEEVTNANAAKDIQIEGLQSDLRMLAATLEATENELAAVKNENDQLRSGHA